MIGWQDIENHESGLEARQKINELGRNAAGQAGAEVTLFKLEGANLNSTADQIFTKLFDFDSYVPIRVLAMDASGAITNATGGIYSAASKGGTAIVANSQVWSGLNSTTKVIYPSIGNLGMAKFSGTPYLSLTTPMGSTGTCDIYILGFIKP